MQAIALSAFSMSSARKSRSALREGVSVQVAGGAWLCGHDPMQATTRGSLWMGVLVGIRRIPMCRGGMHRGGSEAGLGDGLPSRGDARGAGDRKSTRLNSSHIPLSRMPSSA